MAVEAQTLTILRGVVHDSLGKHMFDNAIFFADKLVTLSQGDPDDVYRLAQTYLFTKQYRRALSLLRKTRQSLTSTRFRYLTAKCLAECQEWDEVLATLSADAIQKAHDEASAAAGDVVISEMGRLSMVSAMELLKGSVYESLENYPLAARCYSSALRADPLNQEALDRLVTNHMLSAGEQLALLAELKPALAVTGADWLSLYYSCKLDPDVGCSLAEMHRYGGSGEQAGLDDGYHGWRFETEVTEVRSEGAEGVADGAVEATAAAEAHAAEAAILAAAEAKGEESALQAGLQLRSNCDLMITAAEYEYRHDRYKECHALSSRVLALDPFQHPVLPVHICSMSRLNLHTELFALAHQLVEDYPHEAVSWFAVGCYYHLVQDFESARRYFSKATTLNHRFAPAWVGFGHAFAAQDESDQAMAAYRTASRLFPGSYLPWLGIGIEYLRTNHLPLALQYIKQARVISPYEPLVLHELGVLHYHSGNYEDAETYFLQVVEGCNEYDDQTREPSVFNLGHTYRKLRHFDAALKWYNVALTMNPRFAATYSAIGFTQHLKGDVDAAIELYHQSLSLKPDDSFTCEMLSEALKDSIEQEASDPFYLPVPMLPSSATGGSKHEGLKTPGDERMEVSLG